MARCTASMARVAKAATGTRARPITVVTTGAMGGMVAVARFLRSAPGGRECDSRLHSPTTPDAQGNYPLPIPGLTDYF